MSLVFIFAFSFTAFAAEQKIVATQHTGLNVRSGPSSKYNVVCSLAKGATVSVIEEKNGWALLDLAGANQKLYCAAKYLKPIEAPLPMTSPKEQYELEYLGKFRITHYCTCSKCCGKNGGKVTYSGTTPTIDRTIAVDKNQIKLGSTVYIDGYGYRTAEDTGSGIGWNDIDIFVGSDHSVASKMGVVYKDVWVVR